MCGEVKVITASLLGLTKCYHTTFIKQITSEKQFEQQDHFEST